MQRIIMVVFRFSLGTGFIFSVMEQNDTSIPLLITNYHVLENAVAGFVELHIAEKGLPSEKILEFSSMRV